MFYCTWTILFPLLRLSLNIQKEKTLNVRTKKKKINCNWTRTQNHLVLKRTLNHLAKYRVWIHSETRTWHDKNIQLKKLTSIFYFHTSLWCLKRFYKGIKRFEALQRSAKKNIRLSEMHGTLRVILHEIKFSFMFYQDVLIDKKNVTHILQDKNLEKALIYWHKIFLNLLKIWKQF